MKICLLAVCHNSYKEAIIFLDSLSKAVLKSPVFIDLYFIDNSSNIQNDHVNTIQTKYAHTLKITYIFSKNLGYFPSINSAIKSKKIDLKIYDYAIISNVDLSIESNIFEVLKNIDVDKNLGIIGPSILSKEIGADRNPKILRRPSKMKLLILKNIFRYGFFYSLLKIFNTYRIKMQNKSKENINKSRLSNTELKKIYAAHGSFIILSNNYLQYDYLINYPVFLFGEEIYLSENCQKYSLDVMYCPQIQVNDDEHASTSKMNPAFYRKSNFNALSYILKNYNF